MPAKAYKYEQPTNTEFSEVETRAAFEELRIDGGLNSPARKLQSYLEDSWDAAPADQLTKNRWSTRRMIAFVFVTCSIFWSLVLFAGQAIL